MEPIKNAKDILSADFEGQNWRLARKNFEKQYEDNATVRLFLASRSSGDDVKNECLKMKDKSENKYQPVLGGILENIDALMTLGDVAIKSAPESVGLAWMGVRACLRAVQGDWATFQLFSGACADIIGIMISCRVYGKMYGGKDGPKGFKELHEKVVEFIPQIYTDILNFSYGVYKYTEKRTIIRIGSHFFKDVKGKFESDIDGIKAADVKMRDFARTASERMILHLQTESIKGQEVMTAELVSLKRTLDSSLKSNETIMLQLFEKFEEEMKDTRKKTPYEKAQDEYEENMKHLNRYEVQHDILRENLDVLREPQTCRWIFELNEYSQWHNSAQSSMIWVSGEGGYGKSILMSTVIEQLRAQHSDDTKALVQYFFCRKGSAETQNTDQVFKTIVAHLYEKCLPFPDILERANLAINEGLGKRDKMSIVRFNLEVALGGLLQVMDRDVYLVIDGLDECVDRHKENLLPKIRKIVETTASRTKIMICSRPKVDIAIDLRGIPNIRCEGNNKADIEKNVMTQMRGFPGWTTSEKLYAVNQIVQKSGGQFRFVQSALEFLRKPLVRPFERHIQRLPNGLEGSYITSWNATDPDYIELLKVAFTWVFFADGTVPVPLIMDAYGQTYNPEAGIKEVEEDAQKPSASGEINLHERQIRIAGNQFLEITSSGHVTLQHLTVRDFFVVDGKDAFSDDQETVPRGNYKQECFNQHDTHASAPWTISEKQGHLDILKVLVQNLISPVFQKKYLFPHAQGGVFSRHEWREPESEEDSEEESGDDSEEEIEEDDGRSGYTVSQENHEIGNEDIMLEETQPERNENGINDDSMENSDFHKVEQGEDMSDNSEEEDKKGVERIPRLRDAFGQWLIQEDDEANEQNIYPRRPIQNQDQIPPLCNYDEPEFRDEIIDYGTSSLEDRFGGSYLDDTSVLPLEECGQYRYELTHWVYHLRQAKIFWSSKEQQEDVQWKGIWDNLCIFISEQREAFKAWLRLMCYHDQSIGYLSICRASPLHIAAFLGLPSFITVLIGKGYMVDQHCPNLRSFGSMNPIRGYFSALDFAVCSDNVDAETVMLLVEQGADVNCTDRPLPNYYDSQITPFHRAVARQPTKELVEFLLAHGADSSLKDEDGRSVVHYFSYLGSDPESLNLLLQARPELDLLNSVTTYENQTPLHLLVERRSDLPLGLLKAYLRAGANPDVDDSESSRPLRKLAMYGNAPAVEVLTGYISDVDDVDNQGQTALHVAAQYGNALTLEVLIEKGARLNSTDKNGRTPLFLACRAGMEETAMHLLQKMKGDPEIEINKADKYGSTPLREAASGDKVGLVRHLLTQANASELINAGDKIHEHNALHRAVTTGGKATLEVLIEHGGNLLLKDKNGLTPFQLCIRAWTEKREESVPLEETLAFLIAQAAPPLAVLGDLMFLAAAKGSIRVIQSLLDAGVDPKLEDAHGWTPAMLAQHHSQQSIVDLLSKQKSKGGKRPSGWADMGQRISISADRLAVRPVGPSLYGKTVISDHPTPTADTKYYFEVEIAYDWNAKRNLSIHERLAIGFTTYPTVLHAPSLTVPSRLEENEHPYKESYGWDPIRNILHEFGQGYPAGPHNVQRDEGDVIGCGIDYAKRIVFFTNNRERLEKQYDFQNVSGRMFPAVSIEGRYVAKANFGRRPFQWKGWRVWSTS